MSSFKEEGVAEGEIEYRSDCGTHYVVLITKMPLKTELWKLKTHWKQKHSFLVDTDGETKNTTPLSPAKKEWL